MARAGQEACDNLVYTYTQTYKHTNRHTQNTTLRNTPALQLYIYEKDMKDVLVSNTSIEIEIDSGQGKV